MVASEEKALLCYIVDLSTESNAVYVKKGISSSIVSLEKGKCLFGKDCCIHNYC